MTIFEEKTRNHCILFASFEFWLRLTIYAWNYPKIVKLSECDEFDEFSENSNDLQMKWLKFLEYSDTFDG